MKNIVLIVTVTAVLLASMALARRDKRETMTLLDCHTKEGRGCTCHHSIQKAAKTLCYDCRCPPLCTGAECGEGKRSTEDNYEDIDDEKMEVSIE